MQEIMQSPVGRQNLLFTPGDAFGEAPALFLPHARRDGGERLIENVRGGVRPERRDNRQDSLHQDPWQGIAAPQSLAHIRDGLIAPPHIGRVRARQLS